MVRPKLDIKKFIAFHRKRIILLRKLLKEQISDEKLIFQISFLGIESLAKLLFMEENSSKKRFIELLSKTISKHEAIALYKFWRCPLTHSGFIISPWTTLEDWDDKNKFISFPDGLKSSTEYPAGSIIEMYNHLINDLEKYFKEKGIEKIII